MSAICAKRNLRARRRVDQHSLQRVDIAAVVAQVADVDRVPFAPLDRGRDRFAADRGHQYVIGIIHGQSVACQLIAFEIEVEEVAAGRPLGKHAGRTGDVLQGHLDLFANLFDFAQVGAEHLDAERRAHAGGQHVDAGLDRHGPGIRRSRHRERLVQTSGTIDQFLRRLVVRPEATECARATNWAPTSNTSGRASASLPGGFSTITVSIIE